MVQMMLSWVADANDRDGQFPLNNLPYGVFTKQDAERHCGVAIGSMVLDVTMLEARSIIQVSDSPVFTKGSWNGFMALGPDIWSAFRQRLMDLLGDDGDQVLRSDPKLCADALIPLSDVTLHLPFDVAEYTDFYAGKYHAENVGTMFRGADNALPPNWLHMPIGYNGRASSVVVSGTEIQRPWGQIKLPDVDQPHFAPCEKFDIELELGAIVGQPSSGPITTMQAQDMIFGYVLLNDWSARDIQAWEYQPLGPFQGKATATTLSPWIVTQEALTPFRCSAPARETQLLPYLHEAQDNLFDIHLDVLLQSSKMTAPCQIASTNYREVYYSFAQQLAHHTTSGCAMSVGDLLGSGTISGPEKTNRGSMIELSWGGAEPFELTGGETRTFLEDGDELTLQGWAQGDGYRIGFGEAAGVIMPALKDFPIS